MKRPDPNSKRSQKRRNRGFRSLLESSRKHRRAQRRQDESRSFNGRMHEPGEKEKCGEWVFTAGGAYKYH